MLNGSCDEVRMMLSEAKQDSCQSLAMLFNWWDERPGVSGTKENKTPENEKLGSQKEGKKGKRKQSHTTQNKQNNKS